MIDIKNEKQIHMVINLEIDCQDDKTALANSPTKSYEAKKNTCIPANPTDHHF